ncbi:MAG: carboxypeptidase-like regulatory domain-containing protein, partial [Desulfobacterales bacterium]|nr:carboxypeptidase-like regulatory domain-containing protein [Desulfobacterales bacterium]
MKHELRWGLMLLLTLWLAACSGGKQSAVEGKLVDWNGKPVAGVKILASQVQPIKGYEQFEAVTKSDGTFRLSGPFPSSQYVLKPWSDKWTCKTAVQLVSAPQD